MSFKFDRKKHGSINDNAAKDLPVGTHNYEILKVEIVPVKADKTGKRKHLSISLRHDSGQNYTTFLETTERNLGPKATQKQKDGEEMRARIAAETFCALMDAAGFAADFVMTAPKLKLFTGKEIIIRTDETKNGDKSYVNIREILAGDDAEVEDDEEEVEDEDYDDEEESEEEDYEDEEEDEEDEEEDEEEEEEPAPKPKKKRAPAKKKRAPRKAKPPVEEEDEDEDEDDDPF